MSEPRLSFEESLEKVVLPDKCMGCAACVTVCPFACLEYSEEQPKIVKKCESCGICPRVCPRYNLPWPTLEKFVFGREKRPEEDFGIYRRIVVAQSSDKNTLEVSQDGGIVTTLLAFALKNGIIEGAAISGVSKDRPLYPVPRLTTAVQEVLECAGTRYSYSPNLLAFQEGIRQKKKSLAFVGTPCQIHAIRRIQAAQLRRFADPLRFTVGLMCTEAFTYEGMMEKQIEGALGIDLRDVRKINIKGKVLVTTKSGEVKTISLVEAKQYTRKSCIPCTDFSAELADISVGGLGLSDWTVCVIRTEVGETLFRGAEGAGALKTRPVEEERRALDLLIKLSKKKSKWRSA
jgi:coenzyme F420 hydrogenase subunit beta